MYNNDIERLMSFLSGLVLIGLLAAVNLLAPQGHPQWALGFLCLACGVGWLQAPCRAAMRPGLEQLVIIVALLSTFAAALLTFY